MSTPKTEFYKAHTPTGNVFSKDDWLTENALEIIDDDQRKRNRRHAASVAHQGEMEGLHAELGQAQFELDQQTNARAPMKDTKAIARTEKRAEKLKAAIAKRQATYEEDSNKRGGSLWNAIDLWKSHDLKGPTKDRNTTDTAIDGRSPLEMMNLCGSKLLEHRAIRKSIERRPATRAEIEAKVADDIAALAIPIGFEGVKRVRPNVRGRLAQGSVAVPAVFHGGVEMPNTLGFLVALLQEPLTKAAIDIALRDFDNSQALTMHQREKALADIDAQIIDWEYRAAFWHREIEKTGHDVPRVTTNIWAVLDLVPA